MKFGDFPADGVRAPDYQKLEFDYQRSADQNSATPVKRPVVVVGAGPVGLALAIDLAQRNVPVVLLDNDYKLSSGSRAICFAKRTLEIFDRLECGNRMVEKGVSWNLGRVFFGNEQIYQFDLLPENGHERPAFINLQQYYVEGYLAERAAQFDLINLRWRNNVLNVEQRDGSVLLTIDTPDGPYQLAADYLVACDGSRSTIRQRIGEESKGRVFRDRFLIADVKMKLEQPAERWFWFDPPFHPKQSVLLHMQPDGVWRIDFQLGWDANPDEEKKPENIIPRIKQMLAYTTMKDAEFELEWASVYTFACLRMDKFQHGRIFFAGDSAHGVSPFGARGANSGIQDAENLGWKLAAVLQGRAGEALLQTYAYEREYAADENILNSTRATDFITPKSEISRTFRDAVLDLAKKFPFARTLVNSGRLSTPSVLGLSSLNTPATDGSTARMSPGAPATDAPVKLSDGSSSWLLRHLGSDFTVIALIDGANADQLASLRQWAKSTNCVSVVTIAQTPEIHGDLIDADGLVSTRYDLEPDSLVLLRPDQHVCARGSSLDLAWLKTALQRALGVH